MRKIKRQIRRAYAHVSASIEGLVTGLWFGYLLLRYSYNELVDKFKKMNRSKREWFEEGLYACLFFRNENDKTQSGVDSMIQMTLGVSNAVDLYKFVKEYNDKENETA